jgi:hypothetical protein
LSQGGMVRHWWRLRNSHRGWQRSMAINGIGALATLLVALVIATTKFMDGAWIVVLLIPLLVLMFLGIHSHYTHVERERTTEIPLSPKDIHHRLIVPIVHLDQASQQAIAYARSIAPQVTAIYINHNKSKAEVIRASWVEWNASLMADEQVQLDVIEESHYSSVRTLLNYIHAMQQQHAGDTITVILPEVAESGVLRRLLAYFPSFLLKMALFLRPEIVVTNILWHNVTSIHPREICHRFIVPVAELDRASVQSLAYARSVSPYVIAVHVAIDPQDVEKVRDKWNRLQKHLTKEEETQLVIIESPYRSLLHPLLAYIDTVRELHPEELLTVVLPEFVVSHWWEYPLHNQTALQLKTALLSQPSIVVTNIPQHIQRR